MENHTPDNTRPIGFWLRATDRLITRAFGEAFASEDITRREWMILNVLDGSVDAPHLAERVQRGKKLRSLADRGWVAETDGVWTMTDEGRAAKARLGETVDGIRSRVAGAVSPEDFATTVASLEAIARELGWSEEHHFGPAHRRGFGRRGFGPGFGPGGFGHGGHRGRGHGFGREFGPGHHPGHPFGPRPHDAEHAYERGFDAGFARGREERSA